MGYDTRPTSASDEISTMRNPEPIFITGYMASGKTTFGKALAKRTGRDFIDLDRYIENRFHKSIPEIFKKNGEKEFRRMETSMLHETGDFENTVISCGGGTPCFNSNMDYMLSRGTTVWLETDIKCICRRLLANPHKRPLVKGKTPTELTEFVKRNLTDRLDYYRMARIHFRGELLEDRSQIDSSVELFISLYLAQESQSQE